MAGTLIFRELKGRGRKLSWPISKYLAALLKVLRNATDSRCSGRDSNPSPHEQSVETLPLDWGCFAYLRLFCRVWGSYTGCYEQLQLLGYIPLAISRRFERTSENKRIKKPAKLTPYFVLTYCLEYSSTVKMEPTCSSEMSVYFQQSTWSYIAEDRAFTYFPLPLFFAEEIPSAAKVDRRLFCVLPTLLQASWTKRPRGAE
jgi:hypothetical protein